VGVRKSVFGSSMEKRCFRKLNETWGKKYNIYHNLPFLNVFTGRTDLIDDEFNPITLSDEEYDLLKKTSIDFTICDKKDVPLICIEFDGMQNGFNIGTSYQLRNGTSGRNARRSFIELKLRVAHGSQFPYLILGSEEFRGLSDSVRLTIADGLIGEVLSSKAIHDRLQTIFDPTQCGYSTEEFDELSPAQQSEIIDDWASMIEIECDFEYNPIVREVMRLSTELHATGYGVTFLNDDQYDPDKWIWMQVHVTSSPYGTATVKVCLPFFKTPSCYCPVHLTEEIGRLLALVQLQKQKREQEKKTKHTQETFADDFKNE